MVNFDFAEFVSDSGILLLEDNSGHFPYFVDMILENSRNRMVGHGTTRLKFTWEPKLLSFYNHLMQVTLDDFDIASNSIEECHAYIQNSITASAKTLGMCKVVNPGLGFRRNKPWFDDKCVKLKLNTRTALKNCK